MPTYSYACTDCGDRSEVVQAFTDDSLTVCQVCAGKLRKVFSSVGIVFKGSGFYRTDSRAGAVPKGESKSESTTESKGDAKGESKGDAKGGSKSESKVSDNSSTDSGSSKPAGSSPGGAKTPTPASAPAKRT